MPGAGRQRTWRADRVLVMAAVTGQPGVNPLDTANLADIGLIDAAAAALRERSRSWRDHARAATVDTPWSTRACPPTRSASVTLLAWPGDIVRLAFTPAPRAHRGPGRDPGGDGSWSATVAEHVHRRRCATTAR